MHKQQLKRKNFSLSYIIYIYIYIVRLSSKYSSVLVLFSLLYILHYYHKCIHQPIYLYNNIDENSHKFRWCHDHSNMSCIEEIQHWNQHCSDRKAKYSQSRKHHVTGTLVQTTGFSRREEGDGTITALCCIFQARDGISVIIS